MTPVTRDFAGSRCGFTLTETAVAVAIAAVVLGFVLAGIGQGFAVIRLSRENLRATQILTERFETLRLYSWDQINTTGFVPSSFTVPFDPVGSTTTSLVYTGSVTIAPVTFAEVYTNDVRSVTIQLDWSSGNLPVSRQMTSLVARHGLQSFVY